MGMKRAEAVAEVISAPVTGTIMGGWTKSDGGVGGGSVPAGVRTIICVGVEVAPGTVGTGLVGVGDFTGGFPVRVAVGVTEGCSGILVGVGVGVCEGGRSVLVGVAVSVGGCPVGVAVDVGGMVVSVGVTVGVSVSVGGVSVSV